MLAGPDGTEHRGLVPVRAFPIQAPQEGISSVGPDGKEVLWVAHLNELPPATRQVLEASLAEREFIPVIERIDAVRFHLHPQPLAGPAPIGARPPWCSRARKTSATSVPSTCSSPAAKACSFASPI